MKKSFLRYLLTLTVALEALYFYIPACYGIRSPREIGPLFDYSYKRVSLRTIAFDRPQLILVVQGVDPDLLSAGTGKTFYSIGVAGSLDQQAVAVVSLSMALFYATPLVIKLLMDRYLKPDSVLHDLYYVAATVAMLVYLNSSSPDFIYFQF